MKKIIPIILTLLLSYSLAAQINYEKGYFIDNNGNRTECLIKNIDWINNPTKLKYILSKNNVPKTKTIKEIIKFGIYNAFDYEKFTVNIDRSSNILGFMSTVRKPIFKKEVLFLKVLVEGNANLYYYEGKNLKRFFYKMDTLNIEQLVFKEYRPSKYIANKNERYKQQLWKHLKCQTISLKTIENLNYRDKDLKDLFVKYNNCGNIELENFKEKKKRKLLNITARVGLNSSSLDVTSSGVKFDTELGYILGGEIEYIMPFFNNKWALLIEPTIQHYKSEKTIKSNILATADYKSIDILLGIRYYFFLTNTSKLFINSSYIYAYNTKIDNKPGRDLRIIPIAGNSSWAIGIGYNYNAKFSIEMRHSSHRKHMSNLFRTFSYTNSSLILGYTLF